MGFFDIILLPRIWVGVIFAIIGLTLLTKSIIKRRLRFIFLAVIFLTFGVVSALPLGAFAQGMGLHPSPVCVVTRPFEFMRFPLFFMVLLGFILIISIIGNKFFCGWNCPIGAIQELFNLIPLRKKLKIKLPFKITNWIRFGIFIVFLLIVFSTSINIYDHFNPFHALHWQWDVYIFSVLAVTLIASLFIYRPFCYLICPLGLLTWCFEHISFVKIRVDKKACTECNICIVKSPCPAVPAILEGKKYRPDCHACGLCLEICPEDALKFKSSF